MRYVAVAALHTRVQPQWEGKGRAATGSEMASLLEAEDGDESGLSLGCKRACQSLVAPTRFELL